MLTTILIWFAYIFTGTGVLMLIVARNPQRDFSLWESIATMALWPIALLLEIIDTIRGK